MKHEMIGKKATVTFNRIVHEGEIVDESKNMIHLKTTDGVKKFIKTQSKLLIDNKEIKNIDKRPQDRIKMC